MKKYKGRKRKISLISKFIFILIILFVNYFCIKKIISYNNNKTSIVVNASKNSNELTDSSSSTSITSKNDNDESNHNNENNDGTNKNGNQNNNISDDNQNDSNISHDNDINNDNPNISNREFFKDSVFLGDSITEAISFYDILNESNVVSEKGLSVSYASTQAEKVISINPKNVFILLGENDLNSLKNKPNNIIKHYKELVINLKDNLPNSKIYVLSILTIAKRAEKSHPGLSNDRVTEFNKKLKDMCCDLDVSYINIIPVLGGNEEFFEPDGIHPKYDFYDAMLSYIRKYVTDNKSEK